MEIMYNNITHPFWRLVICFCYDHVLSTMVSTGSVHITQVFPLLLFSVGCFLASFYFKPTSPTST